MSHDIAMNYEMIRNSNDEVMHRVKSKAQYNVEMNERLFETTKLRLSLSFRKNFYFVIVRIKFSPFDLHYTIDCAILRIFAILS